MNIRNAIRPCSVSGSWVASMESGPIIQSIRSLRRRAIVAITRPSKRFTGDCRAATIAVRTKNERARPAAATILGVIGQRGLGERFLATAYSRPVASKGERAVLEVAGREVAVSSPSKVYFPEAGITKLEVVRYYLSVAEGALRAAGGRPNVLVRYAGGIHGEFFYQKRAPRARPPWIEIVALRFPSGRTAEEVVPRDAAALAWMANLGCLELHPHPVRADDVEHPD